VQEARDSTTAIEHFYARRENGSIPQQVAAHRGGYIQHRDVFYPSNSAEAAVFSEKARAKGQHRLTKWTLQRSSTSYQANEVYPVMIS